jgi:hypothetical protein
MQPESQRERKEKGVNKKKKKKRAAHAPCQAIDRIAQRNYNSKAGRSGRIDTKWRRKEEGGGDRVIIAAAT